MEASQSSLKNGKSLLEIVHRYIGYWKWFAISIPICICLGILSALSSNAIYEVSLHTLLNQNNSSAQESDKQLEALGLYSNATNNLENEIIILSSSNLMLTVAEALHLDVSYYTKSRFGRRTYLYSETPYSVYYTPGENQAGEISFSINQENKDEFLIKNLFINNKEITYTEKIKGFPITLTLPQDIGTISIGLTGKKFQSDVYYIEINSLESVAGALSSSLGISQASRTSSILQVSLSTDNIEKGCAVLEELIRQYNENAVNERNLKAYNTSLFINDRLKEISHELGNVEDEVVEYKQQHRIANLSSETTMYMQQAEEFDKQRMDAENQLRIISMVEQFVSENKEKAIPNLGVSDPTLGSTIAEYNNKVMSYEQLAKSTSENNPSRIRMQKELETMRFSILSSIQNERRSIRITISNIASHGSSVSSRIQSVPQQERGLLEKERQQQVIENLFLFLMQKREESNVALASISEKATIISSPMGGSQIAPNTKAEIFSFFILGLIIPIIIICLKEFFNSSINNISDIKRYHLKVIGEICHNPGTNKIVLSNSATSLSAELFRKLRNDIDYHFKHKYNKLILITSSIENEGKSYISLNLATAFALMGKRVLLIDIDMRKSNLSQYIQSNTEKGLTNYLNKETEHWEDDIEYINGYPSLHILKAGTLPPNPNELLMSEQFKQFIENVKEKYDYVILDSSPVGIVSDAAVIAEYVDITLYVVREDKTPKSVFAHFNDEEIKKRLNNLHIIYNGTKATKKITRNAYYKK